MKGSHMGKDSEMDIEGLSDSQLLNCVRELRNRGYGVVVFTPNEVGDADSSHLEDLMVERGWDYISAYKLEEDDG